ncbi:MAG: Tm-1-like ATP-binding domain-containing protein [Candidatus Marinimicrobia bacterium]|nr:Tm-1-like ATP-binding domain-containing protein [Candidatus Neomarinimicrobiota bacterium]
MKKTVLIIANLDTRGSEFKFVKELILSRGLNAILLDFSMEQKPFFKGDITCEEVAKEGGIADIEEIRRLYRSDRQKATDNQIAGAIKIAKKLLEEGKIHGVLGVGGGTSSLVSTSIMKTMPFGMPKLMASSMAGHPKYVGKYVGTKDITMLNTVVDVVEINPILKIQLVNAIGAICGMVEISTGWEIEFDQPVVAITSFGFAERAVEPSIHFLRDKGYIPVPCHAQGRGDRAMDELIRDGWFQGVIDLVSRGIGEQLLDGNCAAGDDRILAASEMGIPQVIAPSGLDMLSVGGRKDLLEKYKDRPQAVIDKLRIEVRTNSAELKEMAAIMANRLNSSKAPCAVLNPLKGWSSLDEKGRALYDPDADAAFMENLKSLLNTHIPVKDVDLHLNTPEFAEEAVNLFHQLYTDWEQAPV